MAPHVLRPGEIKKLKNARRKLKYKKGHRVKVKEAQEAYGKRRRLLEEGGELKGKKELEIAPYGSEKISELLRPGQTLE